MVRPARPLASRARLADRVGKGRGLTHERGELVEHFLAEMREAEREGEGLSKK